nr:MAG TPA: hypothetical protein [Crassvirales sp.]
MLLYCSRRELAVKAKTIYMGSTINICLIFINYLNLVIQYTVDVLS